MLTSVFLWVTILPILTTWRQEMETEDSPPTGGHHQPAEQQQQQQQHYRGYQYTHKQIAQQQGQDRQQ